MLLVSMSGNEMCFNRVSVNVISLYDNGWV